MANAHAGHFKDLRGCKLVAAVDVDRKRAEAFAKTYDIPEVYTSAAACYRESDVDAVSIVTPDSFHAPLSIEALKAGKHVLCEKPLALDYPEAKRMVAAARKAGTINMVNFSYRNWAVLNEVARLVEKGTLGELRHVEASYHQAWLVSNAWGVWQESPNWLWRLSSSHGSKGTLGDVGVHILDFATFPAGRIKQIYCQLKTFPKAPRNRIGPYKLDANDSAVITVEFANGALGSIQTTRWMTGHINRLFLKISGTKGGVCIDSELSTSQYRLCTGKDIHTDTWREVKAEPIPTIYESFVRSIQTGTPAQPDFARGAEIQKYLDACFRSDEKKAPVRVN